MLARLDGSCHVLPPKKHEVDANQLSLTFNLGTTMQAYKGLGLHLIIIPGEGLMIPRGIHHLLEQTVDRTAQRHKLRSAAVHTREDHVHILLSVNEEASIPDFIGEVLEDLRRTLRSQGAHLRSFEWDEAVHVTLLPPWHLEIMASFVRDQDRFHETRTLEDELDEVFRPNSPPPFADIGDTTRGLSALHIN
jgi:REP element-mobilizing transposase RayT